MTALVSGLAAGCAVAVVAAARRPRAHRLAITRPPRPYGLLVRLGAMVRARCHLASSPLHDAWLAAVALIILLLAVVSPPVALLAAMGVWGSAHVSAHRRRRAHAADVLRALPDTVDLLVLCTGAGLALPLAHPLVASRAPAPVGVALQSADAKACAGRPRADALLEDLAPLGQSASSLAHVLADHLRYGVPLRPGLERLSLELRLDRRRRAEEDARKVPVRLLGPLVTCILPAFGLLTVVPLLAASLRALPR